MKLFLDIVFFFINLIVICKFLWNVFCLIVCYGKKMNSIVSENKLI